MLKNYFITAFRNFKKNKSYSFLNILGLAIGMACCLFVFTIINYEYDFDSWHPNKDRIYRVVRHYHGDNGVGYTGIIPYPTGDAIIRDIPDFERVVQFHGPVDEKVSFTDANENYQVFRQTQILYTDENFLDVLDFELIKGSASDILSEPGKTYLTEEVATKYFGDKDPIGQILTINNNDKLEVVGVLSNPPDDTNLPFKMIVSMATLKNRMADVFRDNWGMTWAFSTYVLVQENADIPSLELKLDQMMDVYEDDEEDAEKLVMKLQPLGEVHTDERYGDGQNYVVPSLMIWAFIILGSLLLGTACLNFINLSTAQAIQRAKEIGVRKALGSMKINLILQFLVETFVIVLIALIISFTLGQVFISNFNNFLKEIEYNLTYSYEVIGFALLLVLFVTFLAGFYPAMILSGYKPVDALNHKINIRKGSGNFNLRRALVITQFAFTNLMLISTVIVANQMNFVKSKDLGFNYDNVVTMEMPDEKFEEAKSLLGELEAKSYVESVTHEYSTPLAGSNWNNSYYVRGGEYIDGNNANLKFGDSDYLDFYDIEILTGENVTENYINDTTFNILVNEKLVESLGWNSHEEAIGQWLEMGSWDAKIIGVIENYNVHSLQVGMRASIFSYNPEQLSQLGIRLKSAPDQASIEDLQATFREFFPDELYEFEILADQIHSQYLLEDMLHSIVMFVSILAILLSIMGLYGLVSFMANKNAKSIGIRKVFGASTSNILSIFAKEYALLLVLSFILAAPLAYWLMQLWINEFAYRIPISWVYFIIAFLLSFTIAIVTVGYRSFIAATSSPIKSLRYE